MSIRVTQSTMYDTMVRQMQQNLSAYMESNEQGSSQKKINRPSDDPAGTYRVLTGRDTISSTGQYQTNVDTAKGWLSLGDNVLSTQVNTAIIRLKELANQASSGGLTAENRSQIGYEVREIFGQLLNLSNEEFEGKSIFAGHKYDKNAFEMGLAATTWDPEWQSAVEVQDGKAVTVKPPMFKIEGESSRSMMVEFTSDGVIGGAADITYRWSKDGGATWNNSTLAAGDNVLVADGVRMTVPPKDASAVPPVGFTVKAADPSVTSGAKNGTMIYLRPTAVYQGDDKDPPPKMNIMGGQPGLTASASGVYTHNVLVRMDGTVVAPPNVPQPVDLSTTGTAFNYSYSTDGGSTWVTAQGQTTGNGNLRLPVPGGYMDMDASAAGTNPNVPVGTQVMVHPNRAELDYEIMKDTYISVNSVGKDVFGGYYQGRPSMNKDGNLDANLFEVVGNFVAYCENNNQEGCQKVLAALTVAQTSIGTEAARFGGLENRLEMARDVLSFQKLDQEERLSYTEDIDLTELLTKLSRQQLTYSTVLKSSSMIMQLSLANYV